MDALSVIKFNVVNLAFKTRASSIHLNKFAPGYPQKKNFSFQSPTKCFIEKSGTYCRF